MRNKSSEKVQFRYYDIPKGSYLLPFLGEGWIRYYGLDVLEKHFHNHLEIGFCHEGQGILSLGNDDFPYFPNTFSIIPKNYPHNTTSEKDKPSYWEYLFVDVDSFLADLYPDRGRNREELIRRINEGPLFLTYESYPEIGDQIQGIMREYREQKEFYQETAKGHLLTLLFLIARLQPKPTGSNDFMKTEDLTQIGMALEYVADHYNEQLKIQGLAEKCSLSETHFRRIFQKKLQMTPIEYINQVRIHAACSLMQDTTLSIEDVAEKTGFISMSTFNRNFRKIIGESPKQWRMSRKTGKYNLKNYQIHVEEGWE